LTDNRTRTTAPFVRELQIAVEHLYDWIVLRESPLVTLFCLDEKRDPPTALRRILVNAIESLKPGSQVPLKAKAWQSYQTLYTRYVEQYTQMEATSVLGLSVRHLRRVEVRAIETLAVYLWDHFDLEAKWREREDALPTQPAQMPEASVKTPSRSQELRWLEESLPSESVDIDQLMKGVLDLVQSVARELDVRLVHQFSDNLLLLMIQRTVARQALLTVCVAAVRSVPGGEVTIRTSLRDSEIRIDIRATASQGTPLAGKTDAEQLEIARQLVDLSGGTFEITRNKGGEQLFDAAITLSTVERIPVLVVDDNEDTLQLLDRYLSNSRYRFIGTSDPERAVPLAAQSSPGIVVLDVMLPGVDGWELLGRLHAHPQLCDVPIIVCSIVPQEQLAMALGAANFVPKPFSRDEFLSALDRQLEPSVKGPR